MAIVALLVFQACGDDDGGGGITDEQRQLVMGQTDGVGVFFTGLTAPLTLERDQVHSNLRELDLNNDGVFDITLRAYEEFGGADKGLSLSVVSDSVRVSVNGDGLVIPKENGDIVTLASETWTQGVDLPLAVREAGNVSGLWNGLQNRYVAIRIDIQNSRFLAWVELSVSDFDNYSFHNFVLRAVP